MRRIRFAAIGLALLSAAVPAPAQDFALGIIIGQPTGISWKVSPGRRTALQGAVAWSLADRNDRLHVQADYVVHSYGDFRVRRGRLSWYYGIGGRVVTRENDDARVGLRIPLGLDYLFARAPLDFFVEVVPVLDLVPATDFMLAAGVGLRFVF